MKVALLAESFLPHMNGVTHSLLQVLRHLERRGHEALVVAPRSGPFEGPLYGARSVLLPSVTAASRSGPSSFPCRCRPCALREARPG